MSNDYSIRIQGIAEIQRALFQLNARLGERVTRLALRKGANFMLKQVRAIAPIKTGRLKKAIVVKTSKIHTVRKNGDVGVYLVVKSGKRDNQKTALYGRWLERGYKKGNTQVAGRKFVTNTFNTNAPTALAIMIEASDVATRQLAQELNLNTR